MAASEIKEEVEEHMECGPLEAIEIKQEIEEHMEDGPLEAVEMVMIKKESDPLNDLEYDGPEMVEIDTIKQEKMEDEGSCYSNDEENHDEQIDYKNKCEVCKVIFETTTDLKNHVMMLDSDGKCLYVCCTCKKSFRRGIRRLKDHQRIHTGEKPFECEICQKKFSLQSNMTKHRMLIHNEKRAFQCDTCQKKFKQLAHLQMHERCHSDLRPFKCDVCHVGCKSKKTLRFHQRTHDKQTDIVKFSACPVCSKRFTYFQLKMHMRNHGDSFLCSECNIVFDSFNEQAEHMEKVHSKSVHNECPECKELFENAKALEKHVRKEHLHKCEICNRIFARHCNLRRHMKQHTGIEPFKCEYCSKGFKTGDNYKRHLRIHTNDRPYVCDICNKGYTAISTLKEHKLAHTGKKPYGCKVCKKFYPVLKRAKDHIRKHHADALEKCSIDDFVVIDNDNVDFEKEVEISIPIKTELEEDPLGDIERVDVKEEIEIKEEAL